MEHPEKYEPYNKKDRLLLIPNILSFPLLLVYAIAFGNTISMGWIRLVFIFIMLNSLFVCIMIYVSSYKSYEWREKYYKIVVIICVLFTIYNIVQWIRLFLYGFDVI